MTKSSVLTYRPYIDGLRAIAVMSVLLYHAFPNIILSGYIGVDVFFVISGFLITTIIRRELLNGEFSLLSFYKKRIRRIYPALIIILVGVMLLSWLLLSNEEYTATLKHIISSSLFAENFMLWSEDGYFDQASIFKPTLHIWSLSIEEQFYIFWPLILAFLVKKKHEVKWICFFILLSFSVNIYDINNHPAAAYYSPLGRSWELMVGCLFSVLYTDIKEKKTPFKTNSFAASIGLVMVLLSIFLIPDQKYFPGFVAIPVVFGTGLIIFYGENTVVGKLLSLKPIVFIGLISYPLYLVHWPLMSFSSIVIGHESSKANALSLIVSLILATFIYKLIEKPISRMRINISYSLLSVMIIIPLTSLALTGSQSRLKDMNITRENEWSFLKKNHDKFGVSKFDSNGNGFYSLKSNGNDSYLMIGDSHMANLAEYLYNNASSNHESPAVFMAIGGGCIPIPNVYTEDKRRKGCWEMRSKALEKTNDNNIKNIVIGGAWYMYFHNKKDYFYEDENGKYPITDEKGKELAMKSLEKTIEKFKSSGKNVYFIKDAPYIENVSPGTYRERLQPLISYDPNKNMSVKVSVEQDEFSALITSKAKDSGANIIDIYGKACPAGNCKLIDKGEYIYSDPGHFNPQWLRKNEIILSDLKL